MAHQNRWDGQQWLDYSQGADACYECKRLRFENADSTPNSNPPSDLPPVIHLSTPDAQAFWDAWIAGGDGAARAVLLTRHPALRDRAYTVQGWIDILVGPALADPALPCPQCGGAMHFSSAAGQLTCPACTLVLAVDATQAGEIAGTLAGIYDLPLAQLLRVLYAAGYGPDYVAPEDVPPSPEGGTPADVNWDSYRYPAVGDVPRMLYYCAAQDAYIELCEAAA